MSTVLHVNVNSGNDAFSEDAGAEVARILHKLADHIADSRDGSGTLLDFNGNRVGHWTLAVED